MPELHFIRSDWDSNFFNKEIYKLSSDNDHNLSSAPDLLWAKVDSYNYSLINKLNANGFLYVEGELKYRKKLNFNASADTILLANKSDEDELKLLVHNLYQHSRYRSPWFSQSDRNLFYSTWLSKAVFGTFDDVCLIKKTDDGQIQGFLTLKFSIPICTIGLIGVGKNFQKKNIASQLLEQGEALSIKKGCSVMEVATQSSNIAASNLYIRSGYQIAQTQVWFYKK